MQEIEDAEGILRSVNILVDSIKWFLKTFQSKDPAESKGKSYQQHIQALERLCLERQNIAQRALESLNRQLDYQLDYLTKRHAMRESKAIKTLTILASIYLSLFISASMLEMQSPFKAIAHDMKSDVQYLKGTNLLFDVFGVFIGLSSITIFILYGIRLGLWAKSTGIGMLSQQFSGPFSLLHYGTRWRYGGKGSKPFEFILVSTAWFIGTGFCVGLLIIFLVDMLRAAENAWDTAKWMFAACIITSGALLRSYFGIYWSLRLKTVQGR